MTRKLNKIKEVLAISLFGIVVLAPSYLIATLSLSLGVDENITPIIIVVTLIVHYFVIEKTYGSWLAKRIDSVLGTKTLTATYEITIGENNDEMPNM
jgi:hypothetical protein